MAKIIIYTNEETGGVSLCIPSGEVPIDEVQRHTPHGSRIVESDSLPHTHYDFLNAWVLQDGEVTIDMRKALAIRQDQLRDERASILASLDVQFMKALEVGDLKAQAAIATKKQALRDCTQDPAILNATTPDELKAARPAALS